MDLVENEEKNAQKKVKDKQARRSKKEIEKDW